MTLRREWMPSIRHDREVDHDGQMTWASRLSLTPQEYTEEPVRSVK